MFDFQDSLNSNEFGSDTGKTRKMIGPMNELEGLRGEHTLILGPADTLRIIRSASVTVNTFARMINKTTVVPNTALIPTMKPSRLASLCPTHVLYHYSSEGNVIYGLGLNMSDGVSMQAGFKCNLMAKLPSELRRIQVAITKNEKLIHSIRFEGDTVLHIGSVDAHDKHDYKKGRVETFEIQQAEALLGCEFQSADLDYSFI